VREERRLLVEEHVDEAAQNGSGVVNPQVTGLAEEV
jgi:hypothetical protein